MFSVKSWQRGMHTMLNEVAVDVAEVDVALVVADVRPVVVAIVEGMLGRC
jgi:hypothetical protein